MRQKMFILVNFAIWCIVLTISSWIVVNSDVSSDRQTKSKEMLKYMNLSADPCDDFYEFTCGNFYKYHKVDKDKQPIIGFLDTLNLEMDAKIRQVLESKDDEWSTKSDRKVKSFYRSCVRAPKLKSLYKNKLKKLINEIGQMPLLDPNNWSETEFDWSTTVGRIAYLSGVPIIVKIDIDVDYLNPTVNRVYLSEALAKPKSFYKDDSKNQHEKYINDIAEDLHKFFDIEMDKALECATEMFEFETALAHGMLDERTDTPITELNREISINDLMLQYTSTWDVKNFLNLALGPHTPSLIYVQQTYIDIAINSVLKTTPKYIVANYIMYTYIKKFFYASKESIQVLHKRCIKDTKHYFYRNLDNMIYRRYFTPQTKQIIYFMWQEIKSAFEEALYMPRLSWIQEKSRNYALQKLKALHLQITTYEDAKDDEELSHLHLKDHDYMYNVRLLLRLRSGQARAKLQQTANSEKDLGEIASFTPMYIAAGNFVSVPVSYLQANFAWSLSYPLAYNFANLGFTIGHELMHAFDDGGIYYDASGIYHSWWDTNSTTAFEERIKCFINQYKRFTIEGHPVPEMIVQSENISDNGGIRLAYEAYLKWRRKASQSDQEQEIMPGLNYTSSQLFFISYGQVWCSVTHPDYLATQLASDTHVPDKFRVIGPLANLEEFSQTFHCPRGSVMNPVTKCSIY